MGKNKTKILITGGHMTPALAVQSVLREKYGYQDFIWVGHKYNQTGASEPSPEYQTISQLPDTVFIDLPAGKLVRSWWINNKQFWLAVKNFLKIPYGFLLTIFILIRHRPDVILSFGGYLAVPVVVLGKLFGIKAITHEQTVITGKANQILAKFADKVLISWPESKGFYPEHKTILTGNPLRTEIFTSSSNKINFDNDLPIIYITGGNQGAVIINRVIFAALPEILQSFNVIHQTGSAAESLQRLADLNLPPELASRYIHQPYFYKDVIGEVMQKADIIISRAGANTVTEILALGKPAILIPIPWVAGNEQFKNAKYANSLGIAKILEQKVLTAKNLISEINSVYTNIQENKSLNNQEELTAAKQTAIGSINPEAGTTIAQTVVEQLS